MKSIKKWIKVVALLAVLSCPVLVLYFCNFSTFLGFDDCNFFGELSDRQEDWGSFGGYVGGLLGPLFTAVVLFFMYDTQKHQQTALLEQQKEVQVRRLLDLGTTIEARLMADLRFFYGDDKNPRFTLMGRCDQIARLEERKEKDCVIFDKLFRGISSNDWCRFYECLRSLDGIVVQLQTLLGQEAEEYKTLKKHLEIQYDSLFLTLKALAKKKYKVMARHEYFNAEKLGKTLEMDKLKELFQEGRGPSFGAINLGRSRSAYGPLLLRPPDPLGSSWGRRPRSRGPARPARSRYRQTGPRFPCFRSQ